MKTAIITGISGQDGAYLAEFLLKRKYTVIGLTRNNHSVNLKGLAYLGIEDKLIIEECDLLDISSVISIIKKYSPNEVYNLAAQSSVGLSFSQPIGTINFNIVSVLNLLESIRLIKPDTRFYQASSSEMYGKAESLPIEIGMPMHPLSPYAISKASAYWTVVNYRESYGLYACNGVLFNHESYLRTPNFFVKKVITECLKNKDNPYWKLEVGNIDIKRDFGYSPKYVEAMWLMLQQSSAEDFTICSGTSISLRSIVRYIFEKFDIDNQQLVINSEFLRPTDIEDIYGNNQAAKDRLGWDYNINFFEVLDLLIEEEISANL